MWPGKKKRFWHQWTFQVQEWQAVRDSRDLEGFRVMRHGGRQGRKEGVGTEQASKTSFQSSRIKHL